MEQDMSKIVAERNPIILKGRIGEQFDKRVSEIWARCLSKIQIKSIVKGVSVYCHKINKIQEQIDIAVIMFAESNHSSLPRKKSDILSIHETLSRQRGNSDLSSLRPQEEDVQLLRDLNQLELGLTDEQAVEIILHELKTLLKKKEEYFEAQREKLYRQIKVMIRKLIMPETLLVLCYFGCTVYNVLKLSSVVGEQGLVGGEMWREQFTATILLLLVIVDIVLRVTELNSQVYNVDTEVKKILAEFSDQIFNEEQSTLFLPTHHHSNSPTKTKVNKAHSLPAHQSGAGSGGAGSGSGQHGYQYHHLLGGSSGGQQATAQSSKEFSYYENCFTLTLRNKRWRKVPSNTLARGDIIKLLPGTVTPAFIKQVNIVDGRIKRHNNGERPLGGGVKNSQNKQQAGTMTLNPGIDTANQLLINTERTTKNSKFQFSNLAPEFREEIDCRGHQNSNAHQQSDTNNHFVDAYNRGEKVRFPHPSYHQQTQYHHSSKLVDHQGGIINVEGLACDQSPQEERLTSKQLAAPFYKKLRDFQLFEVQTVPYIDYINDYITNFKDKKQYKNAQLLYSKNKRTIRKARQVFHWTLWAICLTTILIYSFFRPSYGFLDKRQYESEEIDQSNANTKTKTTTTTLTLIRLDVAFLPIICLEFVIPLVDRICEAWCNAVMQQLFSELLANEKITSGLDEFSSSSNKVIKKEKSDLSMSSHAKDKKAGRQQRRERRRRRKQKKHCRFLANIWQRIKQKCLRESKPQQGRKWRKAESPTKKVQNQGGSSEWHELENSGGFKKQTNKITAYEFKNRDIKANRVNFWKMLLSGCDNDNNIVAQMSSVSVFAFIDKQGVTTENAKYVDELAVLNENEQREILDLNHNPNAIDREDRVYSIEGQLTQFFEKNNALNALSLAMMLARNPKETDGPEKLNEVFMSDEMIPEAEKVLGKQFMQKPGFHFHNSLEEESYFHQDCACSLSILLGQTEAAYLQYSHILSLWHMVPNPRISAAADSTFNPKRNRAGNEMIDEVNQKQDRKANSFEEKLNPELKIINDQLIDKESENSLDDVLDINDPEYIEHKLQRQMLLERNNRFEHIMCSIVFDQRTHSFQSFSRGEALTIFENCTDFWNGTQVVPITDKARSSLNELMQQWDANDFASVGFSYKPVTPDVKQMLDRMKQEGHEQFNRDLSKQMAEKQIFLGLLGFKHHKRSDAKKQCKTMEEAGIRPVLFSREGVLETKTLAADLGMDTDWNAWISHKHVRVNQNNHTVLPSGIEEIRKHLQNTDLIPLQVPMFCDVDTTTTEEMFKIYQENGEIVACIGNILNSENLYAFQQANVSIGVKLEPLYRCNRCNGRVNQCRTKSAQSSKQNIKRYKPSKLEELSASLNRLACTFIFDANTNITCVFPVFREARSLRRSFEFATQMSISLNAIICLSLAFTLICGTQIQLLSKLQLLFLAVIAIPGSTISCLGHHSDKSIMKVHMASPKYLLILSSTKLMIKSSAIKVIFASLWTTGFHMLQLGLISQNMQDVGQESLSFWNFLDEKDLIESKQVVLEQDQGLIQDFNFIQLVFLLNFLSIGLESSESLWRPKKRVHNKIFWYQMAFQIAICLLYFSFRLIYYLPSASSAFQKAWLSYQLPLFWVGGLILVGLIQWRSQIKVHRQYDKDQENLSIFYDTKLGMWSPK